MSHIPVLRVLVVLVAGWSPAAAAGAGRTVILVRHAERAGGMSADVPISEAGKCRAEGLARMLAGAGITAIYTSEVARTQQTAAPLAAKIQVQPKAIPAKDVDGLVSQLRAGAAGAKALVVGHSNTLPAIIQRLGHGTVPAIGDGEYDRMFILFLNGSGGGSVLTLRYPGCSE
jgi:broad specificity phosphatase PhoE